jgi:cell division protein FtsI/penicillin-binding protein 2
MFVMLGLVFLLPCAILFQILRIDIWQGKNLRKLWNDQAIGYIPIPAQRGNILDDQGKILATNTVAYHVAIDPHYPTITSQKIQLFVQHWQSTPLPRPAIT